MAKVTKRGSKRSNTYEKGINLKESVQWDDLINVALKPVKLAPKAKRAKGKK